MLRHLRRLWIANRRPPAGLRLFGAVLAILLLVVSQAAAAMLPNVLDGRPRTSSRPPELKERAVWNEYGLEQAEESHYGEGANSFKITAWRMKDPTGALAAFQWQRLAGGRPSKLAPLAVETDDSALLTWHNYLILFEGWKPQTDDHLEAVYWAVPKLDMSPLPTLPTYLPEEAVTESRRYVLGPASLEAFEPRIPPSVAGFHMGAEGQLAKVQTKAGDMDLAIFAYPTPQIARQRVDEFAKIPGAMTKRTGSLVAAVLSPADLDEAERVLASIRYEASVTWNERIPTGRDSVADLLINIFILIGLIILLIIVAGVAVGLLRYRWTKEDEDPMILLHISDPPSDK